MRLVMLGTGNALVTECFNTCFILTESNHHLLVDTGGGNTILHRINHAGFTLQDIHDVFITHPHIDHLLGAVWVVRITAQLMHRDMFDGDINIYSHDEVITLLHDLVRKLLLPYQIAYVGTHIHFITIHDGETLSLLGRGFTFFDIKSDRTKQYGFYTSSLTFCGDELCNPTCEQFVKGKDWVIHEAFCLNSDAETFKPYEKHHSTVKDTCILAQRLGVKNLIITHTEDTRLADRKQLYTHEGRQYFTGNIYVPDDLESLELL